MDGLDKAEAIDIMVRAMSPDVVLTDEIGKSDDCTALSSAARCGAALIASVHGTSAQEVAMRRAIGDLIAIGRV